jgi:hypothetical protein
MLGRVGRCLAASEVSERRTSRLWNVGAMVKKKLAPKAWAERSRLPRFMGLLIPSTPIAK